MPKTEGKLPFQPLFTSSEISLTVSHVVSVFFCRTMLTLLGLAAVRSSWANPSFHFFSTDKILPFLFLSVITASSEFMIWTAFS